jgi:hypothetical protein
MENKMYEEMETLISNTGRVINNCLPVDEAGDCIILDGGYAEYKLREHTGELFEFLGSGEETRKIPGFWKLL